MTTKKKVEINLANTWFLPTLALIFSAAKVFGFIDWSWWFVLLPIWIIPVIMFGLLIGATVIIAASTAFDAIYKKFRR